MATLPTITNLWGRWKAADLALANGAAVASWADSSGNGRTMAQATGTAQPTYRDAGSAEALGGKPVVQFDGTSDYLILNEAVATPRSFTVFVIAHKLTESGNATIVGMRGSTDGNPIIGQLTFTSDSSLIHYWRDNGGVLASRTNSTAMTGVGRVFTAQVADTTTVGLYIDGTSVGSQSGTPSPNAATPNNTTIGGTFTTSSATDFAAVRVAEVLIYNRALTTGELASVHSYAQDEYGITVSDYVATGPTGPVAGDLIITRS